MTRAGRCDRVRLPRRGSTRPGPLAGVRVIELGTLLAGPFAGRLLGDMGAEIIKVEAPGQARPAPRLGPGALRGPLAVVAGAVAQQEVHHAEPARPSAARSCCSSSSERADVVTENFRPARSSAGTSATSGCSEVNPGIVLARISGYGQTGPVRRARRLRVRRRGDGRAPLHQRLPRRAAAAHRHLARRLARRDVRRPGDPRRALPARRARRRARARSSTSR